MQPHQAPENVPDLEYPRDSQARDRWILAHRGPRQLVRPDRPHGYLLEEERSDTGEVVPTATIFLTNRECPWHCLMCDLWKTTLLDTVPLGAIPVQIDYALAHLYPEPETGLACSALTPESGGGVPTPVKQLKLYNSGSFFDPQAIPPADYRAIVERVSSFARVVVECHPAFVREPCVEFRDALQEAGARRAPLEVAMGLETADRDVLASLNKRMTLDQFSRAASFLNDHAIPWRAFVLLKPPFTDEAAGLYWAERSIEFAFNAGAGAVSLIPTRPGNGALDALRRQGQFSPPRLASLEAAQSYGIGLKRGRIFADLWDLERFSDCPACYPARLERLHRMNLEQRCLPDIICSACGR